MNSRFSRRKLLWRGGLIVGVVGMWFVLAAYRARQRDSYAKGDGEVQLQRAPFRQPPVTQSASLQHPVLRGPVPQSDVRVQQTESQRVRPGRHVLVRLAQIASVLVVVVLIGLGIMWSVTSSPTRVASGNDVADGIGTDSTSDHQQAGPGVDQTISDVTVTKCTLPQNIQDGPEADMTVTNQSTQPMAYAVHVEFDAKSTKGSHAVDTAVTNVGMILPGASVQASAISLNGSLRSFGRFTCKATSIDRTLVS